MFARHACSSGFLNREQFTTLVNEASKGPEEKEEDRENFLQGAFEYLDANGDGRIQQATDGFLENPFDLRAHH